MKGPHGGQATKAADWIDRDAFPFTSHFFDVPAGTMHYVDEGEGGPVWCTAIQPGPSSTGT